MDVSWSGCTSGSLGGLSGCLGRKCRSLRSGGIWIDRNMRLIVRGNWQGTGGRFLFQVKSRGKKRRRGKLWGKEERGTSLEGKVVEADRVETGGGREGGGDAGRLECGGEAEDGMVKS